MQRRQSPGWPQERHPRWQTLKRRRMPTHMVRRLQHKWCPARLERQGKRANSQQAWILLQSQEALVLQNQTLPAKMLNENGQPVLHKKKRSLVHRTQTPTPNPCSIRKPRARQFLDHCLGPGHAEEDADSDAQNSSSQSSAA